MAKPAAGAVLLHCGLVIAIVVYGLVGGYFHHNLWGGAGPGGAIQVNITSAIPLPSDHPPNENVLATEKPSEAPAPPAPKVKQAEDETAIPIQGKPKKPERQEAIKTPPKQQPVPTNRAQYGEQAGSVMPRASTSGVANGPTTDRRKFRQSLRVVRRQYQPQDGRQRVSVAGRSEHAEGREGVDRVPHSPRWIAKRCAARSHQREFDMGLGLRSRGTTRRYLWATAARVSRQLPAGLLRLHVLVGSGASKLE